MITRLINTKPVSKFSNDLEAIIDKFNYLFGSEITKPYTIRYNTRKTQYTYGNVIFGRRLINIYNLDDTDLTLAHELAHLLEHDRGIEYGHQSEVFADSICVAYFGYTIDKNTMSYTHVNKKRRSKIAPYLVQEYLDLVHKKAQEFNRYNFSKFIQPFS